MKIIRIALLPALAAISLNAMATGFERLDRGLVAVRQGNDVVLSWRALGSDGKGATYKVYRNGKCITPRPMPVSWYKDEFVKSVAKYSVEAFDAKGAKVSPMGTFVLKEGGNRNGSFDIPIDCPPPGETPDGEKYSYIANEASIGDLDGDGEFEIVLKWEPTNAKDPSQAGYTGHQIFDAYKLSGKRLWRIDFCCLEESHGVNLRDAKTGKELWYIDAGRDCEPAVCGDFDPTNPGFELWAGGVGWLKLDGTPHRLGKTHVGAADKSILWKGDLVRSLLGSYGIFHYDPAANDWKQVLSYDKGVMVGHKLKASPVFVGDFIGDWREEVVMRLDDQSALRVYVSTEPTNYRFRTFLENRQYRIGLALFNIGYNVTAFPSYYFGPENLRK